MKSATAFRTISEVSTELDVPQHVLRFWETKFPQIRPLKRGGGRRYYRPEDVELLRRIQSLLHREGYTIKGVQRLLKEGRADAPDADGSLDTAGEAMEVAEPDPDDESHMENAIAEPSVLPEALRREVVLVLDELKALRRLLGGPGGTAGNRGNPPI
ncbi:DNA-binding transcriptional MerR regulator [Azospirillum soli]|nr:DNA-binding transcriptional MerR regulator [Azospirillum soli]